MSTNVREDCVRDSLGIFDANLVGRLYQLNRAYLALLCGETKHPRRPAQRDYLPEKLQVLVRSLREPHLDLIARSPYALYSLAVDERVIERAVSGEATAAHAAIVSDEQRAFCEIAMLYAWHVSSTDRLAARVMYAFGESTASALAAVALWRIKFLADRASLLLRPRWCTNAGFWPELLRFAAAQDSRRLRLVQLLGHHLNATDLLAQAGTQLSRRTAASVVQRARLRARAADVLACTR